MNSVMLYFDIYIGKVVQAVIAFEGYQITSTNDPDVALRALEASATPCILITDNFGVNLVINGASPGCAPIPRCAARFGSSGSRP